MTDNKIKVNDAIDVLNVVKNNINSILIEEQIAFDSVPEEFVDSSEGERMQSCIRILDDAIEYIVSSIEYLNIYKNNVNG